MDELKLHLDYGKALIYVSIFSIFVTGLTHFIFKKYRFVKYLPGLILIVIGIYNLLTINDITSKQSINNYLLMMIGFGGGLVALFSGLIIGIYTKPLKTKKKDIKEDE